jgi:hypothetical protein
MRKLKKERKKKKLYNTIWLTQQSIREHVTFVYTSGTMVRTLINKLHVKKSVYNRQIEITLVYLSNVSDASR